MHILETEGVPGLYRGNVACCVRIVPYSAIAFSSYEFFRRQLSAAGHRKGTQRLSAGWDLLAGAASGATATLLTYPLDTLRTRLAWVTAQTRCGSASGASASSSSGCSTSSASSSASGRVAGVVTGASTHGGHGAMSSAAATAGLGAAGMGPGSAALAAAGNAGSAGHLAQQRRISHMAIYTLRTEGVTGLYRGLMPTLYGILPYAGLKFYFYALSKQWYKDVLAPSLGHTVTHVSTEPSGSAHNRHGEHGQQRLPLPYMLVFGGVSGLLAQTLTFPLDVVRRQMQVAGLHGSSAELTTFGTAAAIVKAGGVRGLFRGLSLNYIKVVPSTAIGFASYDMLKSYLDVKGNL
ncbi:hypothetical protein HYH03_001396 [Edaphochlamys debaryana]|uniref:Mitochondrial carrier protein n=1 Tax=Edaphochlamys debaryana TaxID=47281 RepID=A0A835YMX5_9CHLO|nr:hypothetical protein HYH03_001396 [Edaphochlamys debaryana]|eukprot:KAG2500629.1 hypothetical protein HYH03_001396 [Edaphochlamys debaryana]